MHGYGQEAEPAEAKKFIPITGYDAVYQLKSERYKISPSASRKLVVDKNGKATLSQRASILIASINQESVFQTNANSCNIESQNYAYQRTVMGKHKSYRIGFDHQSNTFVENYDGDSQTRKIKEQLFDELSYQEVLRCELQNINGEIKNQHFSYNVRTKGKNKVYDFEISGEEVLETALGKVETVKVSRIRDNADKDENSFIWFSKEHNYLLVKLIQEDDDDKLSLKISKLKD